MELEEIKELVEMLNETDISEINLESDGTKISIKKGGQIVAQDNTVVSTATNKEVERRDQSIGENNQTVVQGTKELEGEEIEAPMVGTFYRAPAPDADPFINKGDVVEAGDALCIIEAMKLMNEIEAEFKCKIVDVLIEDGEPIEYGQPLFLVERL